MKEQHEKIREALKQLDKPSTVYEIASVCGTSESWVRRHVKSCPGLKRRINKVINHGNGIALKGTKFPLRSTTERTEWRLG